MKEPKLCSIWYGMKTRCYNRRTSKYKYYGGRGIRMCREWLNDYEAFYKWAIVSGYCEGLTIDRIDVNGNYEPSNCRWVDSYTQSRNKRNNRYLTVNGETKILSDWAREYGISPATVLCRIRQGWDSEKAVTTPAEKKYSHNKYMRLKEKQGMTRKTDMKEEDNEDGGKNNSRSATEAITSA